MCSYEPFPGTRSRNLSGYAEVVECQDMALTDTSGTSRQLWYSQGTTNTSR